MKLNEWLLLALAVIVNCVDGAPGAFVMKYVSPPGVVMSDTVQLYDPAFVKPLLGKYPVAVVVGDVPLKKVAVPVTT